MIATSTLYHFILDYICVSGCCDVVDMVEKTKRFICSQKSLKVLSLCFETTEVAYSVSYS